MEIFYEHRGGIGVGHLDSMSENVSETGLTQRRIGLAICVACHRVEGHVGLRQACKSPGLAQGLDRSPVLAG